MPTFRVEVEGADKVIATLSRFQMTAADRVERAVKESAKEVQRGARQRIRRVSGRSRRQIYPKYSKDGLTAEVAMWGRGRRRAHPLSHIIEFGTAPHKIKPKRKKALLIEGEGGEGLGGTTDFAAAVNHPGQPARPFLFPAWEEERPKYTGRLKDAIRGAAKEAA